MSQQRTSSRATQRHDYQTLNTHGTTAPPQSRARSSRNPSCSDNRNSRHSEDGIPSQQSSIHSPTHSQRAAAKATTDEIHIETIDQHSAPAHSPDGSIQEDQDPTRSMPGSLPDETIRNTTAGETEVPIAPAWGYRANTSTNTAGPSGQQYNVTVDTLTDPDEPTIVLPPMPPMHRHPLTGTMVQSIVSSDSEAPSNYRRNVPFIRDPRSPRYLSNPRTGQVIKAPAEAPGYAPPDQIEQLINDIVTQVNQDATRHYNETHHRMEALERVVRRLKAHTEAQEGAILTNNRRLGEAVNNSLNAYNASEIVRQHIGGLENRLNTIDLQNEEVLTTLRAQDGTLENISDMIQGLDGRVQEEMDSREESYHTEHSSQVPHTPSVRSESPR
jgi:hypothetical protein